MSVRMPRVEPLAVGLAVGLAVVAVLWPAVALALEGIRGGISAETPSAIDAPTRAMPVTVPLVAPNGLGEVAWTSVAWALSAALAGAAIAWPVARVLKRDPSPFLRASLGALVVAPLVLPPWLLYAAVWLSVGPGTVIGDAAEQADAVGLLRAAILLAATSAWSAAVAFAVLVAANAGRERSAARLLELDGAGALVRLREAFAHDVRPLGVAFLACAIVLFCETTVFDLAQVPTFGFELRSLDALGATPSELLGVAWPTLVVAGIAGAALPWFARRAGDAQLRRRAAPASERGSVARRAVALVAAMPATALLVLVGTSLAAAPRKSEFMLFHGAAATTTVVLSLAAALIAGLFAAALRIGLDARGDLVRRAAVLAAVVAIAAGVVPATIAARALEAGYNRASTSWVYDGPAIVVLALVARVLVVGGIAALSLVGREAPSAARLRQLDGRSMRARLKGLSHETRLAAGVAAGIGFAWSLGELIATGRVLPPGVPWLATDLLNAIHYQRPETVFLGAGLLMLAAVPALFALRPFVATLRGAIRTRRSAEWVVPQARTPGSGRRSLGAPILGILLGASLVLGTSGSVVGCGRAPAGAREVDARASDAPSEEDARAEAGDAPEVAQPLEVVDRYAGVGRGPGLFHGPRVLAVDAARRRSFVIDKDARVQRFDDAAVPSAEWRMPKFDRGKPVGASVAPDGTLVIADTHEHRLVCTDPDGTILWTLGTYGREPGQFIYPTDVAFAPDGRMFVGEYGGHDRIQVFGPDRRFLYEFGRAGAGAGEFQRPQALVYDAGRDELYVADVGNHRIQVLTGDGEFRRALGSPGRDPGQLFYPFGLVLEIDGVPLGAQSGEVPTVGRRTVVVAEHSNHRIQRLDASTGAPLDVAGGFGRDAGRLRQPWALDAAGLDRDGRPLLAVCDHGNSRIVFFRFPSRNAAPEDAGPIGPDR